MMATCLHALAFPTRSRKPPDWSFLVSPEDCKGLPIDIWIPEPSSFDYGPDMMTLGFEFTFQNSGGPPFCHLSQTFGSITIILPDSEKSKEKDWLDIGMNTNSQIQSKSWQKMTVVPQPKRNCGSNFQT